MSADARAPHKLELFILLAIVVAGGVLRAQAVAAAPGFWYDEALYALDALDVLRKPGWPVFFDTENHMREPLFMYVLALAFKFFGVSIEVARGTAAAIGTLTIPAVWLAARRLFGAREALLAAAFLAFLQWHVHFSSLCFRTILTPLLAALTLWSGARWVQGRALRDAALFGAILGGGAYTYLSWRLVPVLLLAFAAWWWWRGCGRKVDRAHRVATMRGAATAAAVALLVALPLLLNFLRHPEHFRGRTEEVSLSDRGGSATALLLRQARDVALMPLLRGDHEPKHNLQGAPQFFQFWWWNVPGTVNVARWIDAEANRTAPDRHGHGVPLFDPLTGLLFYFGVGVCAVRAWRGDGAYAATLLLLAGGAAASVFSFGAPNMLRMTIAIPATVCALSIGAWTLTDRLRLRHNIAAALATLAVLHFAAVQLRRIEAWPQNPQTAPRFNTELTNLARALRTVAQPGEPIVMPAQLAAAPSFRFAADGLAVVPDDGAPKPIPIPRLELRTAPPFPPLQIAPQPGESLGTVETFGLRAEIVRVR